MTDMPKLSEADVHSLVSATVLARGRSYFNAGNVAQLVWRDGFLTAEVQGQQYEPYQVRITANAQGILSTFCNCPYDGTCKHIAAVLLYLVHRRDEIEQRPSLATLIAGWSRDQLAALLMRLSEVEPRLADEIERLAPAIMVASAPGPAATDAVRPEIDTSLLRRQIIADVRNAVQTGYDSWGEEAIYDSDLGVALEPALEYTRALLAAGDSRGALEVLKAATEAWQTGVERLDEEIVELLFDNDGDFTQELGAAWAEALLTADLSPAERSRWANRLQNWVDEYYGGEELEIAVTAVKQGWDHPPLVAVMQGRITDQGIWEEGEVPHYADELAQIRLAILAGRGQHEAYLNLAQAEGAFMSYLHMLVQLGQTDKAFQEALPALNRPEDYQTLAATLAQHGAISQALKLAHHGLSVPIPETEPSPYGVGHSSRASLAAWLRDQAQTAGQSDLALWAAQQAFAAEAVLDNYRALERVAGGQWSALKPEALASLRHMKGDVGQWIRIYLYEKMHQEAIDAVDGASWYSDMDELIEAVKQTHPAWAFRQCLKQAEPIMDAGRSGSYDVAAEWLRRGRDILVASGGRAEWESYLKTILEKHHRKYSLMPLLRKL